MWHVSASLQRNGAFIVDPSRLEALCIELLAEVGGDTEWWNGVGESNPAVVHFRVVTTPAEQKYIPKGTVTMDAGDEGTQRKRTR